jgi:thiazole synthase
MSQLAEPNYRNPSKPEDRPLVIGKYEFASRLFVGTGKYANYSQMVEALEAAGTDCVTVAVRRLDLDAPKGEGLLDHLDRDRYKILPNTAGCFTAEDAVRAARMGRELGFSDLVKLEVLGDTKTLLPDAVGTLEAARTLVDEGFTVLCYTSDDPILASMLEKAGVAAVMPAGSPIGSGQGVLNPLHLRFILETVSVPVLVDAGVGSASDVAVCMELGADGVLLNTAIAGAADPVRMARAMKLGWQAGRESWLSGRIARKPYATASSPMEGLMGGQTSLLGGDIPGE